MKDVFLIVSASLAFFASFFYIVSIFRKQTKPHRTTRFVIFLISILTVVSLFATYNGVAIWLAGAEALQSVLMFAFSLRYGMGGWSKSDMLCLLVALFGIYLWQTTKNPLFGLYFAITADFTGFIPTFIKTYKYPDTEYWVYYVMGFFGALFNLFALRVWTTQEFSYPVYILFSNLLMALLIIRPKSALTK